MDDAQYASFCGRLWKCWAHHWQQAVEAADEGRADGWQVAESIRSGRGYMGGGQLGGDPLEDVVLAEAVQVGEPAAIDRFQGRFKTFAIGQGVITNRHIAEDTEEWWCRLLGELGGYSNPPGKLAQFHGRCGLQQWLGTVARNFARQQPAKPQIPVAQKHVGDRIAPPQVSVDEEECLELLSGIVQTALAKLPKQDQALLYLLHVEQLAGKEVANLFQLHAGTISRRKNDAAAEVRQKMLDCAEELLTSDAYEDCLDLLVGGCGSRDFAHIFYESLRQIGAEATQDVRVKECEA
jgi:hypothetical protein